MGFERRGEEAPDAYEQPSIIILKKKSSNS